MRQFKNKSIMKLQGFEDFLERLQEAGGKLETEGRTCFNRCAENMYDELYYKAQKAGLSERLIEEMHDEMIERPNKNIWYYEVGWKKQKPSAGNPLPDTYKVMFYNYGTPERTTKSGANRGKEDAHPVGSHGFIKKAKLAAAKRNKKIQQDMLNEILGGLK